MSYYIYQLIDPRTSEPFYIGKGKDRRIDAHEKEARKGVYSRKCSRIRDIWAAGLQVEKQVIKRFGKEADAYAAEKDLIEQIGLENLTNVVAGGVLLNPRMRNVKVERISAIELRNFAPTLARTLKMLDGGKRLMVFGTDMTASFESFLRRLVQDFGAQKIIDSVRPHGVNLQLEVA